MRHERDFVYLGQGVEARPGGAVVLGAKAQAVHAGVHFQKNALRHIGLVGREHVDLRLVVHRVPQVQARAPFQVAQLKRAFKQQNRPAPAQGAQALGLVQVEQRKSVGAAQAFKCALNAVAIGVGLDHGPGAGIRGAGTRALQVVAQGLGMDGGLDRTGHGATVAAPERRRHGQRTAACYNPRTLPSYLAQPTAIPI